MVSDKFGRTETYCEHEIAIGTSMEVQAKDSRPRGVRVYSRSHLIKILRKDTCIIDCRIFLKVLILFIL